MFKALDSLKMFFITLQQWAKPTVSLAQYFFTSCSHSPNSIFDFPLNLSTEFSKLYCKHAITSYKEGSVQETVQLSRRAPPPVAGCIFCCPAILQDEDNILYQDERVIAIKDINPAAFRHYLVIPKEHIPSIKYLQRSEEDYVLVQHMLKVGHSLLKRGSPEATEYRFGFHSPMSISVKHLHLHCFALPFKPRWKVIKYLSYGPLKAFVKADQLLMDIKPIETNIQQKAPETFC